MAYKCLECGHIFEEGEEHTVKEPHGENYSACPLCLGSYEETDRCVVCGSEQLDKDLTNGICCECLEGFIDLDTCYLVGKTASDTVEINSFFSAIFTNEEIDEILYLAAKQKSKEDFKAFVDEDVSWFCDKLRKEVL